MPLTSSNAAAFYVDRHLAEGRADRPALLTRERTWSYGELFDLVARAGSLLRAAGVRAGDRVVVVLPDTLGAAAAILGAMRIGAIAAPIHTRLSEEDYAFVCCDARPRVLVTTAERAPRMRAIGAHAGWPSAVLALDDDAPLRAAEPSEPAPAAPDDAALLQYTSGSTGRPKGVVHLHRGLLALPDAFGRRLALREDDRCFSAAKLSFGYGFGNSLLFPLAAGASALLRAEASEPVGVLEAIQAAHPTVFFGGPALYAALLAVHDPRDPFDVSSVRLCVSAGEALDPSLFRRWQATFGLPILDGLGSTECLHVFVSGEPHDLRPGSLGTVVPPYELRLLDEAGAPVAPGEAGHVHVHGPANAARYWDRPEATHETMADGWIRTGDLMARAEDGTFRYVGRSDDVFKVRGMKVAPLEVEACLNAHPAVAESVVGAVDDRNGVTIACAYVRLAPSWEPTRELARTLRAHARTTLSPYKVPRLVRFVEQLPRTGTGKLSRRDVADAVLAEMTTIETRGTMPAASHDGAPAPAPLEARGLSRRFRQGETEIRAVDGVDLTVSAGQLVAVMGPSGSGKSTLLHLLGAIDRPDGGEVRLEGREISQLAPQELALVRRRRLGFLLQFFSLLPTLSALENVAFPLLLDGVPDATPRATEALARVSMDGRAAHRPGELSGGEQQRVALARALVVEPAIVLADEPTGNLDSVTGREILALLRQAADDGQSVVVVTHDARAAEQADRVVRMADGRISEPDDPLAPPARTSDGDGMSAQPAGG
jgi:benzoate-CoA ligase family protein